MATEQTDPDPICRACEFRHIPEVQAVMLEAEERRRHLLARDQCIGCGIRMSTGLPPCSSWDCGARVCRACAKRGLCPACWAADPDGNVFHPNFRVAVSRQ